MLATLQREGFEVKERDLMRLRSRRKWFLRGNVPSGSPQVEDKSRPNQVHTIASPAPAAVASPSSAAGIQTGSKKRKRDDHEQAVAGSMAQPSVPQVSVGDIGSADSGSSPSPDLDPEIRQKRQERLAQLAADSEERWVTKKRRRRTRGWAGLPADPPQAPRFPSETTIDESKAYLHLDNSEWATVRTQFTAICRATGVKKKTTAGAEKWQAVKDRLVQENAHLRNEFYGPSTEYTPENKALGLDVLCLDIVKRLRSLETRMTLGEARNILGLNPAQAEQARESFRSILRADQFVSKLATGETRWRELQQAWIQCHPSLQACFPLPLSLLQAGSESPMLRTRLRAMEILSTDIMKRLREEQNRADPDPSRAKYTDNIHNGPGPGPSKANPPEGKHTRHEHRSLLSISHGPFSSASMTLGAGQQQMQALMQQLAEPQMHSQPTHVQYQSAATPATASQFPNAEHRLRHGLHQHSTTEPQGSVSQANGQIDPFLLAVANSNEWSVDEFVGVNAAQSTAQRLQAYAASATGGNQ